MNRLGDIAIIGSGPTTIYFLKHLLDAADTLGKSIDSITIFEKTSLVGCGMPYHPQTTDRYNMSNIASVEIPELPETFYRWLLQRTPQELDAWGLSDSEISEHEIYPRLSLGAYLHDQYRLLTAAFTEIGISIKERPSCEVTDIFDDPSALVATVATADNRPASFTTVIIATGHTWSKQDRPAQGYYGSPWPISKIHPEHGTRGRGRVGTLGASLSAFDVISSLSRRLGDFVEDGSRFRYIPHPGTEGFHLTMHSAQGWLPHLQFEQIEPFRKIYRHTDRETIMGMLDSGGFLRLERFFDEICRPALETAFRRDHIDEMADLLDDPAFGLTDFVNRMCRRHEYDDAFAGMRSEMPEARDSVAHDHPVHWKEVTDDLIYCLNFHAELLPAEDHIILRRTVMPFVLNVIAAMPLRSGEMLLALHDAGKLDLVAGRVTVAENQPPDGTSISVEHGRDIAHLTYDMFVDCSGQPPVELDDYPFPTLVAQGLVRRARAKFTSAGQPPEGIADQVFSEGTDLCLQIGGVDIDASYRLVGEDGRPNPRIYDLAFPHASGVRPYSHGLQACSATAEIVVKSWMPAVEDRVPVRENLARVTEIYEKV